MQKFLISVALIFIACSSLPAAQERVMVGDDIMVSADEDLDDVVCIGCSILIEGRVQDAVSIGGSITIVEGALAHDVVAIGGSIQMRGTATGDVVAIGGSTQISGQAQRDAVSIFGSLNLSEGAVVNGDAVSVLGNIVRGVGSEIHGEAVEAGGLAGNFASIAFSGLVAVVVIFLLLALATWPLVSFISFMILGPQRVGIIAGTVNERAGMCFLVGLATWVASLFLLVLMPLAFFWLPGGMESITSLVFIITTAVGYTGVSFWVGRGMVKGGSGAGATVLGAILVTFIQAIPVIGWFIAFPVFGWLSLGAAVLSGFGTSADWMFPRVARDVIARPVAQP